MTLGEMDIQLTSLLMEFEGESGYGDPIGRQLILRRVTDQFAQDTDAFWYSFQAPVTDGQAAYCCPALYKLRSLNYFDSSGVWHPLLGRTVGGIERSGGATWRNRTSVPIPSYALIEGMNRIVLSPPPLVPTIASPLVQPLIEFEGFGIPSKAFQSDGVTPLFAILTDECPLNSVCHDGIVYRALCIRAGIQRPTPENRARIEMASREADRYLGNLAAFAQNYAPPYRFDKRYRVVR